MNVISIEEAKNLALGRVQRGDLLEIIRVLRLELSRAELERDAARTDERITRESLTSEAACPGPECPACSGEACGKCGACTRTRVDEPRCEHDVIERHEEEEPNMRAHSASQTAGPERSGSAESEKGPQPQEEADEDRQLSVAELAIKHLIPGEWLSISKEEDDDPSPLLCAGIYIGVEDAEEGEIGPLGEPVPSLSVTASTVPTLERLAREMLASYAAERTRHHAYAFSSVTRERERVAGTP